MGSGSERPRSDDRGPGPVTVLADARLRPVRLGKQEIMFKQATASRLYWAGRPAMRIVQALHWSRDVV
jgi:hypothetical protein